MAMMYARRTSSVHISRSLWLCATEPGIPGTDQREGLPLFDGAMRNGRRIYLIKSRMPSQLLGVYLITLSITVRDRT